MDDNDKGRFKEKIIIDTDIGDDIDDALAIALAIKSSELDLIGITTVFKNTEKRAKIALKLLEVFNKTNVPVAKGLSGPLIKRNETGEIPCQYMDSMDSLECYCKLDAVDFILNKVNMYPGEVSIVAIGPLTNIAAMIIKDPSVVNRIKKIIIMGGAYSFHYAEWNILCDPEAARIVFESGAIIDAVGLDVTLKCKINIDEIKINHSSKEQKFLFELINLFRKQFSQPVMILHDPLAVAALIDKSLMNYITKPVNIETRGEFTRGMTYVSEVAFAWDKILTDNLINIAFDVQADKFISLFLQRVFSNLHFDYYHLRE